MPTCFVPKCKNSTRRKIPGISYHAFPKKRQREWLQAIGRSQDVFINQQRICSNHFAEDDFDHVGLLNRLKQHAIPSVDARMRTVPTAIRVLTERQLHIIKDNIQETALAPGTVRQYEYKAPIQRSPESSGSIIAYSEENRSRMDYMVVCARKHRSDGYSGSKSIKILSEGSPSSSSLSTTNQIIRLFHNYSPEHFEKQPTASSTVYKLKISQRRKLKAMILKTMMKLSLLKHENETYWQPYLENAIKYILGLKDMSGTPLYGTPKKVPLFGFAIQVCHDQVMKYVMRSRNGWNNNLNCLQFILLFKRLLLHRDVSSNSAQDKTSILTI